MAPGLGPSRVNHRRGTALQLPLHSAQALGFPKERMGGEQGTEKTWCLNCKAERSSLGAISMKEDEVTTLELGESLRGHRPPGKLQLGREMTPPRWLVSSWDENETSPPTPVSFPGIPLPRCPLPHPCSDANTSVSLCRGKLRHSKWTHRRGLGTAPRPKGVSTLPPHRERGSAPLNRTLEPSALMILRGLFLVIKNFLNMGILIIK